MLLDQDVSSFVKSTNEYVGYVQIPPGAVIAKLVSRPRSANAENPCPD